MANNAKSPYATPFKNAVKRGTPATEAVENIASRRSATPAQVFTSLHKAGMCERQKINGQWVYWPTETRTSATKAKACQTQLWQSLVDWSIASGECSPQQLQSHSGSQQEFMNYCRKFFNRQFSGSSSGSRKSSGSRSRSSSPSGRTGSGTKRTGSYKFPRSTAGSSSGSKSRRYRRAA